MRLIAYLSLDNLDGMSKNRKLLDQRTRRLRIKIGFAAFALISGATAAGSVAYFMGSTPKPTEILRTKVAPLFKDAFLRNEYPATVQSDWSGEPKSLHVKYTLDKDLQKASEALLKLYHPDYGVLVMIDPNSGAILSIANFVADDPAAGNLAIHANFPSASVFKVVTATAALDKYGWNSEDEVTYNGSNHTLYKKNLVHTETNRWSRTISLRKAFAQSINTVFGRIGMEILKPADLKEYSKRYGFNRDLKSDMPIEEGVTLIPDESSFQLAEIASGFTRSNRMSPVQGALIAASAINGGHLMAPYIIDNMTDEQGQLLYQGKPEILAQTASPEALIAVRRLMATTIENGTAVKSFRPLKRDKRFADLEMGGKTGSLLGEDVKGKTDWFVGYAKWKNKSVAIASLTVNKEFWRVKASMMAQIMFKNYYQAQADELFPKHLSKRARRAMASNSQ
jgi:peptidoglycan glycosyltransferase